MVLELDGKTDGQSWIQSRSSEKTLDQVALILRLYCKQEVKDMYSFLVFRLEYISGVNFWVLL